MVKPFLLRSAGAPFALATALLVSCAAHAAGSPPEARAIAKADPPVPAAATPPAASPIAADEEKHKAERRGGFMVGLSLGVGVAGVSGYPADPKKLNLPMYLTETGARPSGSAALWIGTPFTDWFAFGVGATVGGLLPTENTYATAIGILFRLEGFPLYTLGGRLRELGLMLNTGVGFAGVVPKASPDNKLIDGIGCSMIGGGVFYDGFRVKRLSGGPFIAGEYYWSDFIQRPAVFVGWRAALYTKP